MGGDHSKIREEMEDSPIVARIRMRFAELLEANDLEGATAMPRAVLAKQFAAVGAEDFGERLFRGEGETVDEEHFTTAVVRALGLAAHLSPASYYFAMFAGDAESTANRQQLEDLVRHGLALALCCSGRDLEPERDERFVAVLTDSLANFACGGDDCAVSCEKFTEWQAVFCPNFLIGFRKWVEIQGVAPRHRSVDLRESEAFLVGNVAPFRDCDNAKSPLILDRALTWVLSSSLPGLHMRSALKAAFSPPRVMVVLPYTLLPDTFRGADIWTLLYNSTEHGSSANRFQHHCFQYDGPTVVLIRDSENHIFGACIDKEWHESNYAYGDSECRVFSVLPKFYINPSPIKVYDNSKTRHIAHGIGFGKEPQSAETAMIWLEPDFSRGLIRLPSEAGPGMHREFEVSTVEVWGCGSKDVRVNQHARHRRDEAMALLRQKTKRPGRWQDNEDRALLEMAGITVDHARLQG